MPTQVFLAQHILVTRDSILGNYTTVETGWFLLFQSGGFTAAVYPQPGLHQAKAQGPSKSIDVCQQSGWSGQMLL